MNTPLTPLGLHGFSRVRQRNSLEVTKRTGCTQQLFYVLLGCCCGVLWNPCSPILSYLKLDPYLQHKLYWLGHLVQLWNPLWQSSHLNKDHFMFHHGIQGFYEVGLNACVMYILFKYECNTRIISIPFLVWGFNPLWFKCFSNFSRIWKKLHPKQQLCSYDDVSINAIIMCMIHRSWCLLLWGTCKPENSFHYYMCTTVKTNEFP
jgi:hypothetical protein